MGPSVSHESRPCADPVSPHEGISILPGRPLSQRGPDSVERERYYRRLRAGERTGALMRYSNGYSRAEVEWLKRLVTAPELARIVGVDPTTPAHWAKQREEEGTLDGAAVRVGGRWYFDPTRWARQRKEFEPRVKVMCAGVDCDTPMIVSQERLRRTGIFYCSACWPEQNRERAAAEARATLAAMPRNEQGRITVLSDAARAARLRQPNPQRMQAMQEGADRVHRSVDRTVARIGKSMRTRFGYGLTDERAREIAANVRRRLQTSTSRSADDLRSWLVELWSGPLTAEEIGKELARRRGGGKPFAVRYVRKLARDAGLPARPRGRPRK
ncbi:MAG: hypothetical protein ACTHMY_17970 [Solirubrobacteraceae bacterium]